MRFDSSAEELRLYNNKSDLHRDTKQTIIGLLVRKH